MAKGKSRKCSFIEKSGQKCGACKVTLVVVAE